MTSKTKKYTVTQSWDGALCRPEEQILCSIQQDLTGLIFTFEAPFHNDPTPPLADTSFWGLWNFEVVELFLVGTDGQYLEAEFGPYGHHLLLWLDSPRNICKKHLPVHYTASIKDGRWFGSATIDNEILPSPIHRFNIFSIHGVEDDRRYLCYHPLQTAQPDFHQPQRFPLFS